MKKFFQFFLSCAILILAIPLIPILGSENSIDLRQSLTSEKELSSSESSQSSSPAQEESSSAPKNEETAQPEQITVLHHDTGQTETMSMLDYVIGVVCAEIPASFEEETIKAQAVVAYTYARYQMGLTDDQQGEAVPQISTDPAHNQAFASKKEFQKRYGDSWEENWEKITSCVKQVFPQTLTYEEQPIAAAFHAISSGNTEDASNVWGSDLPYLTAVSSEGDLQAPGYEQTVSFSLEETKNLLSSSLENPDFSQDPAAWFSIQSTTPSGYADEMTVCSVPTNGQIIRSIFSLRSADFTVVYENEEFQFTTRGYGHGVGMSQYGANYLALQGQTYDQILAHYYPGTILTG
ncbi:MAG: stage II sporulation protein D [Massiliimalia sp.]